MQRKRLAATDGLAAQHWAHATLHRAFWAWSRAAELAAAERAQAEGVMQFQRLLQVRGAGRAEGQVHGCGCCRRRGKQHPQPGVAPSAVECQEWASVTPTVSLRTCAPPLR